MSELHKSQLGLVERRLLQEGAVSADALSADAVGILDTIEIPIVMIDRACKVVRFNRAAVDSLGASPSDVGAAARDMRALADSHDLEKICLQVMVDEVPSRFEMRNADRWFLVRVAPSSASEGRVNGAVLTFTNITAFRASLGQAVYEREYTKTILNAVIDPLVVLDERMQVQTANRAFYDWFGISREQSQGTPLPALGDQDWKTSSLWPRSRQSWPGTVVSRPSSSNGIFRVPGAVLFCSTPAVWYVTALR